MVSLSAPHGSGSALSAVLKLGVLRGWGGVGGVVLSALSAPLVGREAGCAGEGVGRGSVGAQPTHLEKQCAAVRTQRSVMRLPPQKWLPFR